MKLSYSLGFTLVLFGLAIGAGANYLDMQKFETWVGGFSSAVYLPSDASSICSSLKSKDEYSKKYFSPEMSAILLRDYSTMDHSTKSDFQEIRRSVSMKKSDALKQMSWLLLMASLNFFLFWKFQNKQVSFVPVTT